MVTKEIFFVCAKIKKKINSEEKEIKSNTAKGLWKIAKSIECDAKGKGKEIYFMQIALMDSVPAKEQSFLITSMAINR